MNKYELLETIGEGAYGIVIKAKCKETGQLVAIKRFKESDEDEIVRKTTLREVKILRQLKDENYVVKLIEAFRRKGRLYLVFEYVGKNLLELLEDHPNGVPEPMLRRMAFSMLLAVYACHSNGVIHRDIKPENLLIAKDGTLRLCDFGFARQYVPGTKDLTDYVATRWYRSPELLLGTTDYQIPIDLFAAGCIIAELIDGQPLFPGESEIDQMNLISRLLGPFTQHQQEVFSRNPRFAGMLLPRGPPDQSLDRRYGHKLNKMGLHLLKSLLVVDPQGRLTVEQALQHPYFEGLIAELCPQLASTLVAVAPSPVEPKAEGTTRRRSASRLPPSVDDAMPAINSRPQSSAKNDTVKNIQSTSQPGQYRNIGASKQPSVGVNVQTLVQTQPISTPNAFQRTGSELSRRTGTLPRPLARGDVLENPTACEVQPQQSKQPAHSNLPRLGNHGLPPSGNGPAPSGNFSATTYNPFLNIANRNGTRGSRM